MSYRGFLEAKRTTPARLAGSLTVLFGLVALAGWLFRLPMLTRVLPGAVEMKANTAAALVLCGAALIIMAERSSRRLELLAQGFALTVVGIGLASLAEYLFAWQMGIDELLTKDVDSSYSVFRGRMSPFTAVACIALGVALAAMPRRNLGRLVKISAGCVALLGAVCLIGYLWNVEELVTDNWLPPMAVMAAVCFVLLGSAILLTPNRSALTLDVHLAALAAVEIKIVAGFLLAMSLLLLGGSYTYRTSVEFADSVQWVAHTQEVRATLADLYGSLAAAELAQRDYLLTDDPARMADYARLTTLVRNHLAALATLTEDNPDQRQALSALQSAVAQHTHELADSVDAIQRMDAIEVRLLAQRQAASANVRDTTLISLLITLAVSSVLFYLLFRGIHRAMLARRDAERARNASDQYNRSIVESSPDALTVLDLDARVSQMTPQGMRLMNVQDFSAIANRDWYSLWSADHQAAARRAVAEAKLGSAGRFQGSTAAVDGTPKWWDVIVMPILGADGDPERLLAAARDITEAKRNESELITANRFLDSLIENLPLMVFVKDAEHLRFVRHNRAGELLLGLPREQLIGKSDRDFFPPAEAEFMIAKDRQALAAGRLVDIPEESVHTRLLGVRTLHTMKLPIEDQSGAVRFLLGISVDITEPKLAEQAIRALNDEMLARTAQLESANKELESFSYSVSHDLRAPLRAIDGFALMIEEDYLDRLDAEGRRYLSVIRENSRRMGALIDDLLAFSRLGRVSLAHREVNTDSLVREVVAEVLEGQVPSGRSAGEPGPQIEVGPLPPAQGDRGMLRQVWLNLISNAVKYSSKASQPIIEISGYESAAESFYCVRDNGVGFNMEYVAKLFGVFQRLHRADEFAGTGVGLAIVQRIVARHGGRVWAEARVDQGAVFTFTLPKEIENG